MSTKGAASTSTCLLTGSWYRVDAWVDASGALQAARGAIGPDCRTRD